MRIPLVGRLRRNINGFRKKFASKAVILMYHLLGKQIGNELTWLERFSPRLLKEFLSEYVHKPLPMI